MNRKSLNLYSILCIVYCIVYYGAERRL